MNPVAGLLRTPMVRTALPYVGIALVMLLAVVAYMSLSAPPPRTLYPEMADVDKEAAQQLLQKNGIGVALDKMTGSLTVPVNEFHEARMMLAAAGLPKDSAADSSSINEAMPLGTSQFMEQARYNAAIEAELAQSIRRINTIKDARVHLALPRQSAFVRDRADPKASVIVTPWPTENISRLAPVRMSVTGFLEPSWRYTRTCGLVILNGRQSQSASGQLSLALSLMVSSSSMNG